MIYVRSKMLQRMRISHIARKMAKRRDQDNSDACSTRINEQKIKKTWSVPLSNVQLLIISCLQRKCSRTLRVRITKLLISSLKLNTGCNIVFNNQTILIMLLQILGYIPYQIDKENPDIYFFLTKRNKPLVFQSLLCTCFIYL